MRTRLTAVALILVVLSVWTHATPRTPEVAPPRFNTWIPLAFGEWVGRPAPPLDPAVARVLAADEYVHRYYGPRLREPRAVDRRALIEMDVAYYARPQAGAAMHSPLNCLPGNGWQIVRSGSFSLNVGGTPTAVRSLAVSRGGHRVAMTYWFQNRGSVIGTEYRQRFQLLANGLQGRPTDAALVRVMARDTAEGHAALAAFTRQLASLLATNFR